MGLGWLADGKNIGTQMGGCSSALDMILIDGGIEIQNGWVAHTSSGGIHVLGSKVAGRDLLN
jgi:hypothetical protein